MSGADRLDYASVVSTDGRRTHVLVPAAEYDRAAASGNGPSRRAVEAAARVLNDPGTVWHDAESVLAEIVRSGVEKARRERGLTQAELGKLLGMPQSQVSRLERNPDGTTLRVLRRVAEALASARGTSTPRRATKGRSKAR